MKVTISYITARTDPRLDWLIAGLDQQAHATDEIELIVVDALGRPARQIGYRPIRAIKRLVETTPKPNRWQGKYRVTSHDFWAKSQAANTALCLARHDYVAFLDDRCLLGDRWLSTVRDGYLTRKGVQVGAYEKIFDGGEKEIDHRLQLQPNGKKRCSGGWLYGCTFALPLAWALDVNGFEEGMDGLAQEDCVFGLNLANAGYRLDFVPSLFVTLRREQSTNHTYERARSGGKLLAALERFQPRKRTEFTPDLRMLRSELQEGRAFPLPDPNESDWYEEPSKELLRA